MGARRRFNDSDGCNMVSQPGRTQISRSVSTSANWSFLANLRKEIGVYNTKNHIATKLSMRHNSINALNDQLTINSRGHCKDQSQPKHRLLSSSTSATGTKFIRLMYKCEDSISFLQRCYIPTIKSMNQHNDQKSTLHVSILLTPTKGSATNTILKK